MALTNKRICVTGGAGFIGSHLVSKLVYQNEVVVFDNLHRNALQFAHLEGHKNLSFIKGDVLDYDSIRKAVDGCQIVIHCAAIAGVYTVDRSAVRTMAGGCPPAAGPLLSRAAATPAVTAGCGVPSELARFSRCAGAQHSVLISPLRNGESWIRS